MDMRPIPEAYLAPCANPGCVKRLNYGEKFVLLYTPAAPARHILYLIHGGGGNQHAFFCPAFLNMIDHMIEDGLMPPIYIVAPTFYKPNEKDTTPASSGRAVAKFPAELRDAIMPLTEGDIGIAFDREHRLISGFSMGGVTTWYAFLQALDLFYWFLPLSGDSWICGETGGGKQPKETARLVAEAVARQGNLPYHIHALTGDADIAYPNLDAQIRAMRNYPDLFGDALEYSVMPGGVHDYETIFRYLYNALPALELDG